MAEDPFGTVLDAQSEDEDGDIVLTVGALGDGDSLTLEADADPRSTDTKNGMAVATEATFVDSSHDYETTGGDAVEAGDEVVLVTWGTGIMRALQSAHLDSGGLAGETFRIDKTVGNSKYDVTYDVTLGESDD